MKGKPICFVGLLLLAFVAETAHAESQPRTGIERRGFLIGFSLGGGSIMPDCDGCDNVNGLAFDFHIGGALGSRLGIMFDGSAVVHPDGSYMFTNSVNTVAIQYWVLSRFWLKGGLGVGRIQVDDDSGRTVFASETGTAGVLAGGFEVIQTRAFAIDAQVRLGTVVYKNDTLTNASVSLGFNWY